MSDPLKPRIRTEPEAAGPPVPRRSRAPRRILLFNVKHSPNLGDGLLVECMEREIESQLGEARVESVDLAGRSRYAPGRAGRALALSMLQASPLPVRHAASKLLLGSLLSRKLQPLWREKLRGADAAIVGGGNLFSDSDLNFPLKLRAAMAVARESATPLGVFAVGVSDNWSVQGEALFADALAGAPLFHASVRDARSAEIWNRRLGPMGVAAPSVVCDPGLLASAHFATAPRPARDTPEVGVGVMHPASIKYHSDEHCASADRQIEWTLAFVSACLAQGWTVRLFTNGSPEDEAHLRSLAPALAALDGGERVGVEPRFETPGDLAWFVSGLDLMYAHRLHANIAAYSYAVPQVGFSWDAKLKSFLAEVGRGECLVRMGVDAIEAAVQLGGRQLRTGVDQERRRAALRRARAGVGELVAAIQEMRPLRAASAHSASA
jgi:polysaccharide pyruvyl transferase WcaK-like protein